MQRNILKLVNILCFSLLPAPAEPLQVETVSTGDKDLFMSRNDGLGKVLVTHRASGAAMPQLPGFVVVLLPTV